MKSHSCCTNTKFFFQVFSLHHKENENGFVRWKKITKKKRDFSLPFCSLSSTEKKGHTKSRMLVSLFQRWISAASLQIVLGGPLGASGMHLVWHKQGCGISYRASKVEVVNSSKMDSSALLPWAAKYKVLQSGCKKVEKRFLPCACPSSTTMTKFLSFFKGLPTVYSIKTFVVREQRTHYSWANPYTDTLCKSTYNRRNDLVHHENISSIQRGLLKN